MNKYDNLMTKIGTEFNIKKGKTESVNDYKVRLIYSVLGRMAVSSLLDDYDNDMPSIVHMKNRVSTVFDSYYKMYPELSALLPEDAEKIANEIYDIYSHTGIFYYIPNRIVLSKKSDEYINGVVLTRGYELGLKQAVSGLGTYIISENSSQSDKNIFYIDTTSLRDRWQSWIEDAKWSNFKVEGDIEYLRMDPPFTRGYWVNKPNAEGEISILRTGFKGNELYYLYKIDKDKKIQASQLPNWIVDDYQYRSLANACLYNAGVLPPITYLVDGDIVDFKFGYLPPPAELYLWKLYSWPTTVLDLPKDFNRVSTKCIFESIAELMKKQGYAFVEEN